MRHFHETCLAAMLVLAASCSSPFVHLSPSERTEFERATRRCESYAWARCGSLFECERSNRMACLHALGWGRTREGWQRFQTDGDLGREIDEMLAID